MKVIQIPEELYERLKNCVVDPFDDTPESVISRLIDITEKAKSSWSPLDAHVKDTKPPAESQGGQSTQPEHWRKQAEPVL
jgi:hypothetical protein